MKMLPLQGEYMLGETQTLHISSFRRGQHDTCGVSCAVRVIYSSVYSTI